MFMATIVQPSLSYSSKQDWHFQLRLLLERTRKPKVQNKGNIRREKSRPEILSKT